MATNVRAIKYISEVNEETGKKELKTNDLADELIALGIKPKILTSSISLFSHGIGRFDLFQSRVAKMLQPDVKNPEKQLKNATEILARSALGKYQIVPIYHFKHFKGWNSGDHLTRLKIMYDFLRSPEIQDKTNMKIIKYHMKKYNGDPWVMAAAYYGGPGGAAQMKTYREAIKKGGPLEGHEALMKTQAYGFNSKFKYATEAVEFLNKYAGTDVEKVTAEHLIAFQKAIGDKESGYLAGKRVKTGLG